MSQLLFLIFNHEITPVQESAIGIDLTYEGIATVYSCRKLFLNCKPFFFTIQSPA